MAETESHAGTLARMRRAVDWGPRPARRRPPPQPPSPTRLAPRGPPPPHDAANGVDRGADRVVHATQDGGVERHDQGDDRRHGGDGSDGLEARERDLHVDEV